MHSVTEAPAAAHVVGFPLLSALHCEKAALAILQLSARWRAPAVMTAEVNGSSGVVVAMVYDSSVMEVIVADGRPYFLEKTRQTR